MTTTNEGTQRDELAQDIAASLGGGNASVRAITNVAEALITKGYRKPRTVESPQDLDGLPFGSVVLDYYEVAWTCSRRRVDGTLSEWLCTEFSELVDSHYVLQHGPVIVLHSPEATA